MRALSQRPLAGVRRLSRACSGTRASRRQSVTLIACAANLNQKTQARSTWQHHIARARLPCGTSAAYRRARRHRRRVPGAAPHKPTSGGCVALVVLVTGRR